VHVQTPPDEAASRDLFSEREHSTPWFLSLGRTNDSNEPNCKLVEGCRSLVDRERDRLEVVLEEDAGDAPAVIDLAHLGGDRVLGRFDVSVRGVDVGRRDNGEVVLEDGEGWNGWRVSAGGRGDWPGEQTDGGWKSRATYPRFIPRGVLIESGRAIRLGHTRGWEMDGK
jgi:hypothetical protein